MNKFKVGDRVRAYEKAFLTEGIIKLIQGKVIVIESNNNDHYFHRKQCRKLIKKPRRRIWVAVDQSRVVHNAYQTRAQAIMDADDANLVEFVEVKK